MKTITNNPYRIAGVLADTSEKEILKQKSKFTRLTEVGKEITSEYDFPFLSSLKRDNNNINKAFSDIEQNQDKVSHSLFWFISLNTIDQTAIEYLKGGNKEKAFEIWGKLTDGKDVNFKNFSAFNNIGTLYLLEESKEKHEQGITSKIKLIESENFKDFVYTVADKTFTIDSDKQIEMFVDTLLTQFKNNHSIGETVNLFDECNERTKEYVTKKFTEEPIHKIENQIEQTKNKRIKDKINAHHFGTDLYTNTSHELKQLMLILGPTNLQYKMLVDNLANEILQCSIDYFNKSQDQKANTNYLGEALKLTKLVDEIAVNANKITKDRIKDSIETLERWKDRELSQAVEFLKSVKNAYEANEREIRATVKRQEVQLAWGQSIDWCKVEEMIKKSIDWPEVNRLLKTVLSDDNLLKIKRSPNTLLQQEFINLAEWVKKKTTNNHNLIIVMLQKYNAIPPDFKFEIISAIITNTDKTNNQLPITNPLYKKTTRYVGLNLNVEVAEPKRISFFLKYIGPNKKISSNSEISPAGYTLSVDRDITIGTKTINLSGWGSSEKCTYEIGKHHIEVWVEGYMIYRKEFVIDFAPSEKLEQELKRAEEELKKIKNRAYYDSDIKKAYSEMNKIEKFHLFRSNSKKQTQIYDQQNKIKNLQQKAAKEKQRQIEEQNNIIYKLKLDIQNAEY